MTGIFRSALFVLVAGIAATAATPAQAAAPQLRAVAALPSVGTLAASVTGPQFGCQPDVGAIEPDGSLNHVILTDRNLTGSFYRDYVASIPSVTTLGATSYAVDSNLTWFFRTFTVRGGALTLETTRYPNSNPGAVRYASRAIGGGWGPMTKIVDASDRFPQFTKGGYLYGLNTKAGTLARYAVTEATFGAPTLRLSGYRTGYGSFRSLALAYRYRSGYPGAADVLIGTTAQGGLYLITVPVAGTFAPRLTLLRASTWTFDDLVVGGCDNHYSLIGVRSGLDKAYLFRLDTISGTSSVIRSYGAIGAPWTPAHSSGIWDHGTYPTRW